MLDPILSDARRRADEVAGCALRFRQAAARSGEVRPFAAALSAPGLSVIAEVKRRSPSRGVLAAGLDAVEQAGIYDTAGASAISVLTEPDHFDGSLEDLASVRSNVTVPVLRKDFLIEPAQVWEARAYGADAALLIVAVVGADGRGRMMEAARAAGLAVLVEVHDETEARIAVDAGATLIGVNNRDLSTFVTDLSVAERLAPIVRSGGAVVVAESGIHAPEDAARMAAAGYDAVLVGEALVTADDPASRLAELVGRP
jgi:indole-3-glycerol phosphate synthase